MRLVRIALVAWAAASCIGEAVQAASDVSNTPTLANKATGSVAASIASSQTSTIISTAATGGFTAGTGGFSAGGTGGFSSGGTGGFSGGGTGGFGAGTGTGTGGNTTTPNQPQAMNFRYNGQSGGDDSSRVGVWAQALWANVHKSEQDLQMKGNVYSIMGGVDRRFGDSFLAGVSFGYEDVDFDTTFNSGKYKDHGETVAPYIAWTLSRNWTFDASVSYSWLTYDSSRNEDAFTGSFSGHRFGANADVVGAFAAGNWRFQPRIGVIYSLESQNSYADSTLAQVDANVFALGRMTAGGKVGYDIDGILPYVKMQGEWDFRTPPSVIKTNGAMSIVDHGGGVVGLGFEVNRGGMTGSLEGDYTSLGRQDLDVWAIIGRLRWEF